MPHTLYIYYYTNAELGKMSETKENVRKEEFGAERVTQMVRAAFSEYLDLIHTTYLD